VGAVNDETIRCAYIAASIAKDYEKVAENERSDEGVRFLAAEIAEVARRIERKILGGADENIDPSIFRAPKHWKEKRPTRRVPRPEEIIDPTPPPPDIAR
jgi:hypothetical protein